MKKASVKFRDPFRLSSGISNDRLTSPWSRISYLIGAAVEATLFEVCLFKKHFARYSPWGVVLITLRFNLLGLADIFRGSPE